LLVSEADTAQSFVSGEADESGTPLTDESLFRVGSIAKTFVAVLVMQLVEEERLGLEAELGQYLGAVPLGAGVTIRALLSHESGLPDYTRDPQFREDVAANRSRVFAPGELLAYVAETDPAPVGAFNYSNTNYILLGLLLERITGQSLPEILAERIFDPAGLSSTSLESPMSEHPSGLAGGWSEALLDGEAGPYASIASSAWAAGGLISSAGDLERFLRALFTDQLLLPESLRAMVSGPGPYGLGLIRVPVNGRTGYGHGGATIGYSSYMVLEPESGNSVIALTNNDSIDGENLASRAIAQWSALER
jgi:D-alanyl-D-alanine carboxypeptidase